MDSMSDISTISTDISNKPDDNENEKIVKETDYSSVDLDIQIQNERILSILNETIYKTEIIIFLLRFDDNDEVSIKNILVDDHFQMVKEFCAKSEFSEEFSDSNYEAITDDDIQKVIVQPGSKIFPELSNIIWIIKNNLKMEPIIKEFIKNLQKECQKEDSEHCNVMFYLNGLIKLKSKIKERLHIFAEEKLKNEVFIRNLNKTNKALKLKIADITKRLAQEKEVFKEKFSETEDVIKKLQEQLDFLNKNSKAEITNILLETENEMSESYSFHSSKLNILEEKDNESKEHYECILQENLDTENQLRTNRRVIEKELLKRLGKYDKDIGFKQATLDDLTEHYEDEKRQLNELQERFDLQEKDYIPLMAQKEEEYQKEVLHKMTTFLMEHAARVIQRMWRSILAARAEKKRLKKLASKKKKVKDSSVSLIQV